ncbi:uncharacterized protein B0I36DRAFT_353412 [Microdochium trichocladiopsis]|uniref:Uncharacterized protein n=1 Tax=Microdochium trichocladiopsis TaxID=1682393 RepID=A0A9P8Y122_9PEZI|nr:uncharacterized protein B0I36DRAFT_353412 [Microdochium trichocladiopsis]KAH7025273.1 hypothetical protein B0I36DRAFT_353412 [Microdochium trichocladiopsis]
MCPTASIIAQILPTWTIVRVCCSGTVAQNKAVSGQIPDSSSQAPRRQDFMASTWARHTPMAPRLVTSGCSSTIMDEGWPLMTSGEGDEFNIFARFSRHRSSETLLMRTKLFIELANSLWFQVNTTGLARILEHELSTPPTT